MDSNPCKCSCSPFHHRCGPGTMMYANGDVYEGLWAADKKNGTGTYFYMSKGKRFDGVWADGAIKCGTYSEIHAPPPGTPGVCCGSGAAFREGGALLGLLVESRACFRAAASWGRYLTICRTQSHCVQIWMKPGETGWSRVNTTVSYSRAA